MPGDVGSWDEAAVTSPTARGSLVALVKGVLSLLAGTLKTNDAGPSQTVTRTYVTSADATGLIDLTTAPAAGLKAVLMDLIVSVDTAMSVTVQEETSGTVFAKLYLPANGSAQITPRGYLKAAVAAKKLQLDASVAGNVAATTVWFTEA